MFWTDYFKLSSSAIIFFLSVDRTENGFIFVFLEGFNELSDSEESASTPDRGYNGAFNIISSVIISKRFILLVNIS